LKNGVLVSVENGDFSKILGMKGCRLEIRVGAMAIFVAEFPQFEPRFGYDSANSRNPFVAGEAFYWCRKCL
jgi:hypothetical protein